MTRPTRKTLLASLLILLWAAAMLAAYWWYEARYVRSFSEQTALFYGEQLRLPDELAGPGPIRLVHFWDPACPCNVGNQQHLAEVIKRFAPQGVTFHAVQKPGSTGSVDTVPKEDSHGSGGSQSVIKPDDKPTES